MSDDGNVTRFTEALNVMNAAIEKNKSAAPYKQILAASEKLMDEANIGVAVYDSDPAHPFDYYTVRFHDGTFELSSRGKKDTDVDWKVSKSYLDQVRNHPDEYIQHPAKLDWDWLKDRLGV